MSDEAAEALDSAFREQVRGLFSVLCAGLTDRVSTHEEECVQRFRNGFRIAVRAHELAMGVVHEAR